MPRVSSDISKRLQKDPSCIRNICILAHVDHGKTSLSDSLLASNGIISQRLAGRVRYLDSRPDEQLRGITMESSAISLYFRVLHKQDNSEEPLVAEHLINLIDSPGHIDFSSEVSAASRLCDGAVVLVDVVEGVCSQTVTVLRQCWTEKLKPILVLNKMDRLINELQLTPQEAYFHLTKIIEQVNSIIGSFYVGDRVLDDLSWREQLEQNINAEFIEKDDADLYFEPSKNNVIFSSAIDGWGFNIGLFAKFYEQKLGAKRENLQKVLWGDFYMDPKTKKIINNKGLKGRILKPLFVSLILDNIWKIYDNVLNSHDSEVLEKITKTLNIKVLPRDLKSKDYKNLLKTILGQWIPVSTAILLTVVMELPSPLESQQKRIKSIIENAPGHDVASPALISAMQECDRSGPMCAYVSKILSIPKDDLPVNSNNIAGMDELLERRRAREEALIAARTAELAESISKVAIDNDEVNLYSRVSETAVTPMMDDLIRPKNLTTSTQRKQDINTTDSFEVVSELAPEFKLDTESTEEHDAELTEGLDDINSIPEFVPVASDPNDPLASMFEYEEEDPFGNDEAQLETDIPYEDNNEELIAFTRLYSGTLKVGQEISVLGPKYDAKQPAEHIDQATITSLYLFMGKELVPLNECPSGNIIGIGGLAGKVLKSGTLIEKNIQGVNLASTSSNFTPIVRVALEPSNPTEMSRLVHGLKLLNQADPCVEICFEDSGEVILCTAGELHLERCLKDLRERFAGIEISCSPPVIPYRETFLKTITMNPVRNQGLGRGVMVAYLGELKLKIRSLPLPKNLTTFLVNNEEQIKSFIKEAESSQEQILTSSKLRRYLEDESSEHEDAELKGMIAEICRFGPRRTGPNILISKSGLLRNFFVPHGSSASFELEDSILNGFELAVSEGPLAKEPVQGMAIIIEDIQKMSPEEIAAIDDPSYQHEVLDLSGRLITTTRDAIHQSFLDWSPRIMWAMYTCEIQASIEVLGKVYAVVQQRRGRIVSEEMKEGTPFFHIIARIPVVEAFGFTDDVRKKTSGAAHPQLVFSGYECLNLDPFWVPTTEEELEELGNTADRENIARKHMNDIRRRKGLFVNEKVIQNAEKQRTLKRN
ncbi:GTPase RIA1 Ecym_6404 [Eremothecium cymbalariae DBVPG|uniref:Ribosome assembly protein 1 n=1 Tax=Eremothecium cymbalariae (strain CBS 270.75 / DBVPG 7215 / KCTC 17166 / NRRL Y-17582) TaxID=931890 RepID=G8JUJ8_ERECY|nr:hypothetical protein Ecym_6404 [Eremothecium cymbalariae DBVPG\